MRIAIDARALSHPQPGGFKTYTTNLIRSLPEVDGRNQYHILLDRPVPNDQVPTAPNVTVEVVDGQRAGWGMPYREQVRLPLRLRGGAFDLFHAPCATGPVAARLPLVVTIHDAIEFLETGRSGASLMKANLKRLALPAYSRAVQRLVARRAATIITDSTHSRDDLVRYLGVDPALIRVIPLAPSPIFRVRDESDVALFRRGLNLPPAFALALVSSSPRKNAAGLLRIYAQLPEPLRARFPLVMLWAHSWLMPEIETLIAELELAPYVRFMRNISDDDLALLYNAASVFVFPSLYEGFGLPVLEAMACGLPVVASNLTSVPELAGDGAVLANPSDEAAFAAALRDVLDRPERRASLRKAGLQRAAEFSWQRTARMTLDVYQDVYQQLSSLGDTHFARPDVQR